MRVRATWTGLETLRVVDSMKLLSLQGLRDGWASED